MLHRIGDELLARTYVVQDFVMPDAGAAAALAASATRLTGIYPLWVCPVRALNAGQGAGETRPGTCGFGFPVRAARHGGMCYNVGVYGPPHGGASFDPVELNRALEARVTALGGRKMLYAQSFYTEDEFWPLFDRPAYARVRARYGADAVFGEIADKPLLGPKRLAALRGVKEVDFTHCLVPMAKWYLSLWAQWLLPAALHPALGLAHTVEPFYHRVF